MRSERQALADIAKLCDDNDVGPADVMFTADVRAILADVQPEPTPAGGEVLMPPETLMERVKADGRLWKAGVAAGRKDASAGGQYKPGTGPEQALAWEQIVNHSALQPAFDMDMPLLPAVLAMLTQYERWDDQRVAAEEALACRLEGRDWVGNPDGTLVYWQREAEDARAKAAAAEQKLRRWVAETEAKPAPAGGTIDSDALRDLILWAMHAGLCVDTSDVWVERFLALVRPVAVDQDAALAFITRLGYGDRSVYDVDAILGELGALVRPVEGVVLTSEDARQAASGLRWAALNPTDGAPPTWGDGWRALAERLEAAS